MDGWLADAPGWPCWLLVGLVDMADFVGWLALYVAMAGPVAMAGLFDMPGLVDMVGFVGMAGWPRWHGWQNDGYVGMAWRWLD